MSFDPAATRPIGRRSLAVSQLGVGTAPLAASRARIRTPRSARPSRVCYAAGLRYFDTAPFYGLGLAEHRLGAALRTVDRRSIVLETKIGRMMKPVAGGIAQRISAAAHLRFEVASTTATTARCARSSTACNGCKRTRWTSSLIHDVNRRWQGDLVEQRYREAMDGAHRALHDLRAQGAIKAFGVGVNDWTILQRFAADGDFDCFMLAGRYTLLDHSALDTFMPDCERRGISVLMAAPFNSGHPGHGREAWRHVLLCRVPRRRSWTAPAGSKRSARRHGVAIAAAALQFPLAHPAVSQRGDGHAQRARSASEPRALSCAYPSSLLGRTQARGADCSTRAGARSR